MKTTIDRAGRLVVPKALREAARLEPGTTLDLRLVDGRIEIEPAPIQVSLERRGKLLVAIPKGRVPRLTAREVEAVTAELRGRGGSR